MYKHKRLIEGCIYIRVPKSLIPLEYLLTSDDIPQFRNLPAVVLQGTGIRVFRLVDLHEFKLEDHVKLFVSWKNISRQFFGRMREGCLADCDKIIVWKGQ